jgi:branched-chain amino acid aminotransferase
MSTFASIDGNVVPEAEARVSVLDNGFIFGDSVYETLRTYRGRPFLLDRHLARLRRSAGRLGFQIPPGDDALTRRVDELLARSGHSESTLRIVVSRGVGDVSYHFDRVKGPTVVIIAKVLEPFPPSTYTDGIGVAVASVRRNHPESLDPAIKSSNLLNNILAVREAQARGADEAILLNHAGEVAEGASSNLFVVRGTEVRTPPLDAGILAGITRDLVLEIGPGAGVPVREARISVADLFGADEAFVTSSLRELAPVTTVDGRPVGSGRPGPVTARLHRAYLEYTRAHGG